MALVDKSYKKWQGRFKPIANRVLEIERREQMNKMFDRMLEQNQLSQQNQMQRERLELQKQDQASIAKYREQSLAADTTARQDAATRWEKEFNQRAELAGEERDWREKMEEWNREDRLSQQEDRRSDVDWRRKESEAERLHREKEEGWRHEDIEHRREREAKEDEVTGLRKQEAQIELDAAKRKGDLEQREIDAHKRRIENARKVAGTGAFAKAYQQLGIDPRGMTDEDLADLNDKIADQSIRESIARGKQSADPDEKNRARFAEHKLDVLPKIASMDAEAGEIERSIAAALKEDEDAEVVNIEGEDMPIDAAKSKLFRLQSESDELKRSTTGEAYDEINDPYSGERKAARPKVIADLANKRREGANPEEIAREIHRVNESMGLNISSKDLDAYDAEGDTKRKEHAENQAKMEKQRVESGRVSVAEIRAMSPDQKKALAKKFSQIASGDEQGRALDPKYIDEFAKDPIGFIEKARPGAMRKVFVGSKSYLTDEASQRQRVYEALDELGILDDVRREAAEQLDKDSAAGSQAAMEAAGYPAGQMPQGGQGAPGMGAAQGAGGQGDLDRPIPARTLFNMIAMLKPGLDPRYAARLPPQVQQALMQTRGVA